MIHKIIHTIKTTYLLIKLIKITMSIIKTKTIKIQPTKVIIEGVFSAISKITMKISTTMIIKASVSTKIIKNRILTFRIKVQLSPDTLLRMARTTTTIVIIILTMFKQTKL